MFTYKLKVLLSETGNRSTKWVDTGMMNLTPLSSSPKNPQIDQKVLSPFGGL